MSWCQARTTDMVNTPRFQSLMGQLAAAILQTTETTGEMDGDLAFYLLDRADKVSNYRAKGA